MTAPTFADAEAKAARS